jgi:hypothetical protein
MADYTNMRCLHCGKELALLKRLTGSGEFCSDQHKQSYHDEYNRLALSRLLQAQTKTDEGRARSGRAEPDGPTAPDTAEPSKRERGPALPVPVAHKPELTASVPAGFLPEPTPLIIVGPYPEAISSCGPLTWEPVLELPALSRTQPLAIEITIPDPPLADLLQFSMQPLPDAGLAPVHVSQSGPFEPAAHAYPLRQPPVKRETFDLPLAGPVSLPDLAPAPPATPELSRNDAQPFFPEVFQLLVPPAADGSVELPAAAAECNVGEANLTLAAAPDGVFHAHALSESLPEDEAPENSPEPETDIESLNRLQNGLRPKLEPEPSRRGSGKRADQPASGSVVDSIALESLFSPAPRRPSGARVKTNAEAEEGGVATLQLTEAHDAVATEQMQVIAEATAPLMEQLLPITLRVGAPAKARLASEARPLSFPSEPQIHIAEILPLRPKIGAGKPPAGTNPPAVSKPPSTAVKVKSVKSPGDPVPSTAVKPGPNDKPFDPKEAVLAVKRSINVPESRSVPAPRRSEKTPPPAASAAAAAPTPAPEKPAVEKPVTRPAASAPSAAKAPPVEKSPNRETDFELHLGLSQKASLLSSIPLWGKLAVVAVLLIALGGVGYLVFRGPAKSASAAGGPGSAPTPSLLMGEGGWTTDWAGDTTGRHHGRKISVYRPSLNLTNYQLEFQGKIENNSMGWVFRAADASNFYAIKLTATGSGYRLIKYSVVDGKEREIGQVPIRPVDGAAFPIRLDVRGDRFTTFIAGNPVDVWIDSQHKTGGVGFLNDRGDRAEITKVGISLLPATVN